LVENLFSVIEHHLLLSKSDKEVCTEYFEPVRVSKNTFLEEENKVPKYLYFISSGFMRLFYYDEQGDEITTLIASPDRFITPFLDFIHEKKTNLNLESITDVEGLRIERSKIAELIDKNQNFKQFSLVIFEQAMATLQIKANDLATLTADLRYKKLIEHQPEIVQNVPVQYIASYLGIKPQSLSRIRKQIIK
jgi:CRP/FNR family transcriptional regulator, anaerobic regulatory protein